MVLFSNVIYIYALLCNHVSQECGPFKGFSYLAEPMPEGWHRLLMGETGNGSENASLPVPARQSLSSAAIAAYILAAFIGNTYKNVFSNHEVALQSIF